MDFFSIKNRISMFQKKLFYEMIINVIINMASFHNSVNLVNHNWIQCTNNAFLVNNFPVWEYPNLEVIVVCQALPGNEVTLSFKMECYNTMQKPECQKAIVLFSTKEIYLFNTSIYLMKSVFLFHAHSHYSKGQPDPYDSKMLL